MATQWLDRHCPYFLILSLLIIAAYFCITSDGPSSDLHVIRISSPSSSSSSPPVVVEKCEESYGFLPCTTTVLGNLFMMLTYGFIFYNAGTYLSARSELLLELTGSRMVGGLLPILDALPDALLVLVSGLSMSRETAQSQVLIGMGALAGSTIFLLTLVWGTCIGVGKCDLGPNGVAIDLLITRGFSMTGAGVTTDFRTSYIARLMAISVIPLFIALFPTRINNDKGSHEVVLLALIISFLLVPGYCLFLVSHPWIQNRKVAYAKHMHVISGILRHAQKQALGRLLHEDGTPNESVIRKLFHKIDMDQSNSLSRSEMHALIIGINFDDIDFDKADAIDKIMLHIDTSRNEVVEEEEFVQGMKKWLEEAKRSMPVVSNAFSMKFIDDFHARTRQEHDQLVEKSDEVIENKGSCAAKAMGILLGAAAVAVLAEPFVDTIHNFSNAIRIPSFFVSFIAIPLSTKSNEAISVIFTACRKKQRSASLAFSEIYGRVTINTTLCLGVFLAVIYIKKLKWEFSSELLIVLLICIIVSLFTSFRITFPLWTCLVAYILYPLSLVTVYILDHVFGWS